MRSKHYLLSAAFAVAAFSSHAGAQVITTFAGTGTAGYTGDYGLSYHAEINGGTGVAVDGAGNVYIADMNNNVVRKVNTSGIITTFAGTDTAGYSGNGGAATAAKLNQPYAVATDVAGNVYISDMGNNVVRVVSVAGIINTYAGNDSVGYNGDGIPANHASLDAPQGLAIDAGGNLYIADAGSHIIRKVNTAGIITTVAGTGYPGYAGDNGLATSAQLHGPSAVAVDVAGDLFIADGFNNVVREVNGATGIITTFAGNNTMGDGGDGGPATSAQLYFPSGVSLDQAGSLYIADKGNSTIRRVDSLGNISIFAGKHTNGYTGDFGTPTNAELNSPVSVTADGWGRIYIADEGNNVIRVVTQFALGVSSVTATGVKIYPNPSCGTFTLELPAATGTAVITVMDMAGNVAGRYTTGAEKAEFNLGNIAAGNYLLKVISGDKTYTEKIEVIK